MDDDQKDKNTAQELDIPTPASVPEDERLITLLAYFSTLVMGILIPIVIYFSYKKRSRFVAFNALQIIYLSLMYGLIIFLPISITLDILHIETSNLFPENVFLNYAASFLIGRLIFLGEIIYCIIYGLRAFKGNIVKFPVVGKWAYEKVYESAYKKSFNLNRDYKSEVTYTDKAPEQKKGKGLI